MSLQAEVLFVNPDYIKRITNINGSIEDAYLVPSIILSQDKYIQLYLGTDLLDKLKSDISSSSLTGDYATLMNDYVRKATLWWTMVELIPSLYVKMDNGSLVLRVSEGTQTISPDDLHPKWRERVRTLNSTRTGCINICATTRPSFLSTVQTRVRICSRNQRTISRAE